MAISKREQVEKFVQKGPEWLAGKLYDARKDRFGTEQEKLRLTALLSGDPLSEGSIFAQRMLDRDWEGWRDTDLSVEQVWALRYGNEG